MLRYLRTDMGLRGKVGVYGRSMGGIATCHLSSMVDMVIMDRTFATLEKVIDKKFFGVPAVSLYSTAAVGWDSNNVCRLLTDEIDKTTKIVKETFTIRLL